MKQIQRQNKLNFGVQATQIEVIPDKGVKIIELRADNLNQFLNAMRQNRLIAGVHNVKQASITLLTQY